MKVSWEWLLAWGLCQNRLHKRSQYLPFKLGTDPGVPPEGYDVEVQGEYEFYVHSIILGDGEKLQNGFMVQIYYISVYRMEVGGRGRG